MTNIPLRADISTLLSLLDFPWILFGKDGAIQEMDASNLSDSLLIDPAAHANDAFCILDNIVPAFSLTVRPAIEERADPCVDYPVRLDDGRFYTLSIRRLNSDLYLAIFRHSTEVDYVEAISKTNAWMDSKGTFGLFLIKGDGQICSWNVSARSLFLYKKSDIVGSDISKIFAQDQIDMARDGLRSAASRGWFERDTFLRRKDGTTFNARIIFSLQRDTDFLIFSAADLNWASQIDSHIHEIAAKDGLTGAFNRRYFNDILSKEVMRYRRYGGELSMIMLDADHFKRVNDTYGHEAGDHVLRAVVHALNDMVRKVDLIARIGGEEFAIILPSTPTGGAAALAERLRHRIERLKVPYGDQVIEFTASLGVSSLSSRDQTLDDLLRAADRALYRAKEGGRNKVEVELPDAKREAVEEEPAAS